MGWANRSAKSLICRSFHPNRSLSFYSSSPVQIVPTRETLNPTSVPDSRNLCSDRRVPSVSAIKTGSLRLQVIDAESSKLWRSVSVIGRNGVDMEAELDGLQLELSRELVIDAVRVLGDRGNSAFRFFRWVSCSPCECSTDPEVYNVVVDNLFSVEDYESAAVVLRELSIRGFSVTEKAFRFLKFRSSNNRRDSVVRMVETLKRVGGSCLKSGINDLIRVLCELGLFDLAVFVMEVTVKRTSYYNALIAAKCRNGDFRGAKELLDEMRMSDCNPTTSSYNYLLGSLFKNGRIAEGCELLQLMEESGYKPDEVTYEVVIFRACKIDNMDVALEFLNKMILDGLKPRLTTHATFIKGCFRLGKVVDAHKYVVDMGIQDGCSANANYSLLANLYRMSGRLKEAAEVLNEMMEKGLKPNFPVYTRMVKDLQKVGKEDIAANLRCKFAMFPSPKHLK